MSEEIRNGIPPNPQSSIPSNIINPSIMAETATEGEHDTLMPDATVREQFFQIIALGLSQVITDLAHTLFSVHITIEYSETLYQISLPLSIHAVCFALTL